MNKETLKIAVLADLHYARVPNTAISARQGHLAQKLLATAADLVNGAVRPDVVLMMGDLVDKPDPPEARELLAELKAAADTFKAPTVIIPGNHDPAPGKFYSVFGRPPDHLDVKGFRIMPFIDKGEPECNAGRNSEDIRRMAGAGKDFPGFKISVQHVPLFPPGTHSCPYNYVNADEIIRIMKESKFLLSVGGHFHEGLDPLESQGMYFTAAPALCEAPFRFMEITIGTDSAPRAKYHALKYPASIK